MLYMYIGVIYVCVLYIYYVMYIYVCALYILCIYVHTYVIHMLYMYVYVIYIYVHGDQSWHCTSFIDGQSYQQLDYIWMFPLALPLSRSMFHSHV